MLRLIAAVIALAILAQSSLPAQNAIVPFKIHVADSVLADLKDRLGRTRFPGEIANSSWDYGTNLAYLKDLVSYWRDRFDWRAAERRLNQFDQFTTNIDGLDIHFVHQRSKNPNAMPIAITHGWPGSFVEFTKIIGPLTDPVAHGGNASDSFQCRRDLGSWFRLLGKADRARLRSGAYRRDPREADGAPRLRAIRLAGR